MFHPRQVQKYVPTWITAKQATGGDFFDALHTSKANIITGHIKTVNEKGIDLKSGQKLEADIIVTATGLKLLFAGGVKLFVDGKEHHPGEKHTWHGAMLQDLPNLAFIFGYTNAPWTLGADSAAKLFVRLLKNLRKRGMTSMIPKIGDSKSVKEVPWLDISATYVKTALVHQVLPKGGDIGPWKPRTNYFQDYTHAKWGDITTDLQLYRINPRK